MLVEIAGVREGLAALLTLEGPLAGMHSTMTGERGLLSEALVTLFASERFLATVRSHVQFERISS